jgi:hypothetical protein
LHGAAPNDLQRAILALAATLPAGPAALAVQSDLDAVAREQLAGVQCTTAGDILLRIETGFRRFFRMPGSSPPFPV